MEVTAIKLDDAVLEAGGFGNATVSQERKPEQKRRIDEPSYRYRFGLFTPSAFWHTGMIKDRLVFAALNLKHRLRDVSASLYHWRQHVLFPPMYLGLRQQLR